MTELLPPRSNPSPLDAWTVGAIAVVAYVVANLVHEGVGHGGACVLTGGMPRTLNAVFFDCDTTGVSSPGIRLIAAAGSVANLVLAMAALLTLRMGVVTSRRGRYFLWLLLALNLLQAFGYLMFSGIGGVGDWVTVAQGTAPPLVWRTLLAVLGTGLYFVLAPRVFMPWLEPFLGAEQTERGVRARRLSLLPYLVGGGTYLLAGMLNPYGMVLVLISAAAASLGGASLLAWYPPLWARRPALAPEGPALAIGRSMGWLLAALLVLVVFVGVLGPGVNLARR
jgi:hypothetical protein